MQHHFEYSASASASSAAAASTQGPTISQLSLNKHLLSQPATPHQQIALSSPLSASLSVPRSNSQPNLKQTPHFSFDGGASTATAPAAAAATHLIRLDALLHDPTPVAPEATSAVTRDLFSRPYV